MSVSTTANEVIYTGNGSASAFSFPYPFVDEDDLEVVQITIASGAEDTLTKTTDYTVTGEGDAAGGTVTLVAGALSSSYQLRIRRATTLTQASDFRSQGTFYPETHEDALDKLTLIAQDLNARIEAATDEAEVTATGSSTARTLALRFAEKANVKDYGAAGDGTTDDTAAVAAAYAVAKTSPYGVVYFPAGTYKMNLTVADSNIAIEGVSREAVIFKPASTSSPVISVGDGTADVSNVSVSRVSFTSDGSGASSDGLKIDGAYRVIVEDVSLKDFGRDNLYITSSATRATYDVKVMGLGTTGARRYNLAVVYGATSVKGVQVSDLYSSGYNDAAARALYTDCPLKIGNAYIEVPATAAGHIELADASASVPAALAVSGFEVQGAATTNTLVKISPNGGTRTAVTERIFGSANVNGVALFSDTTTVDCTGTRVYLGRRARARDLYVMGKLGFNQADAAGIDEAEGYTDATVHLLRNGTGATARIEAAAAALRAVGTYLFPFQFGANAALWRNGTSGKPYYKNGGAFPSSDTDGDILGRYVVTPPATLTSTGETGQWSFDAQYLYVCTAADTWKLLPLLGSQAITDAPFNRILTGSASWNPGSVNDGNVATNGTVTVTGAALGDPVAIGFSHANLVSNPGAILTGIVYAADTVRATLLNKTGSTINFGSSGTLKVIVFKL